MPTMLNWQNVGFSPSALSGLSSASNQISQGIAGIGNIFNQYAARRKEAATDEAIKNLMIAAPEERQDLLGQYDRDSWVDSTRMFDTMAKLQQQDRLAAQEERAAAQELRNIEKFGWDQAAVARDEAQRNVLNQAFADGSLDERDLQLATPETKAFLAEKIQEEEKRLLGEKKTKLDMEKAELSIKQTRQELAKEENAAKLFERLSSGFSGQQVSTPSSGQETPSTGPGASATPADMSVAMGELRRTDPTRYNQAVGVFTDNTIKAIEPQVTGTVDEATDLLRRAAQVVNATPVGQAAMDGLAEKELVDVTKALETRLKETDKLVEQYLRTIPPTDRDAVRKEIYDATGLSQIEAQVDSLKKATGESTAEEAKAFNTQKAAAAKARTDTYKDTTTSKLVKEYTGQNPDANADDVRQMQNWVKNHPSLQGINVPAGLINHAILNSVGSKEKLGGRFRARFYAYDDPSMTDEKAADLAALEVVRLMNEMNQAYDNLAFPELLIKK